MRNCLCARGFWIHSFSRACGGGAPWEHTLGAHNVVSCRAHAHACTHAGLMRERARTTAHALHAITKPLPTKTKHGRRGTYQAHGIALAALVRGHNLTLTGVAIFRCTTACCSCTARLSRGRAIGSGHAAEQARRPVDLSARVARPDGGGRGWSRRWTRIHAGGNVSRKYSPPANRDTCPPAWIRVHGGTRVSPIANSPIARCPRTD